MILNWKDTDIIFTGVRIKVSLFCKDACRHNNYLYHIRHWKLGQNFFSNFVSGALMTLQVNISMYLTYLLPLGIHRVHAYFYMYMIDHFEYLHDIWYHILFQNVLKYISTRFFREDDCYIYQFLLVRFLFLQNIKCIEKSSVRRSWLWTLYKLST